MTVKMTLLKAANAAGTLSMLGEQILPGRIAKVIFDNRKELQHQIEFLENEERKLISEYGAKMNENGRFHVDGDEKKNEEFCNKMLELQQMEVEIHPIIVSADQLLEHASIKPKDIENIEFLFEVPEEKGDGEE